MLASIIILGYSQMKAATFYFNLGSDNGTNTIFSDGGPVLFTNHNEWWHLLPLAENTATQAIAASRSNILVDVAIMIAVGSPTTTYWNTNWVSGRFYTNTTSKTIQVASCMTNNYALIAGSAGHEIRVGQSTNSSIMTAKSMYVDGTTISLLVPPRRGDLRCSVPSGGYFVITNMSSGAGNSSTLNGGELVQFP